MTCRYAARRIFPDEGSTYAKASPLSSRSRPIGRFRIVSMLLAASFLLGAAAAAVAEPMLVIAFGDSLSAGFQLPADAAFPAVLEARLRKDGYDARVMNAAISGDTTRGGLARLGYALRDGGDLLILELGANDMMLGHDPRATRENLEKMVALCEAKGVQVTLGGMIANANFGPEFKQAFDAIYPRLAEARGLPLYPFFLEGVVGEKGMTLPDGLHPSRAGVERIVSGIAPLVEKSLDAIAFERGKGTAAR